jgi:hypothetical protein
MAWAIFYRTVHMNGAQRVPKSKFGFMANAAPVPQQFPQDFVDFAVARGAAERVPSPSKSAANRLKKMKDSATK